ncbi:hypothetical protein AWZ87_22985 [Shigella sonnei]|nr:hypothetical protein AWZ87_22985 [Shigella sonnei]
MVVKDFKFFLHLYCLQICTMAPPRAVKLLKEVFLAAEDHLRELVRSRGLGDGYKRQEFQV